MFHLPDTLVSGVWNLTAWFFRWPPPHYPEFAQLRVIIEGRKRVLGTLHSAKRSFTGEERVNTSIIVRNGSGKKVKARKKCWRKVQIIPVIHLAAHDIVNVSSGGSFKL